MKKYLCRLVLHMVLILTSCISKNKNEQVLGMWVNTDEKCEIQINKDFTFKAVNLPLDVENRHYLPFNKQEEVWSGLWLLENNQLKLKSSDNRYYYYLKINYPLIAGEVDLYVKLLDEVGGEFIYFDKLK